MFAARYFAPRYFAPRYFPNVGAEISNAGVFGMYMYLYNGRPDDG